MIFPLPFSAITKIFKWTLCGLNWDYGNKAFHNVERWSGDGMVMHQWRGYCFVVVHISMAPCRWSQTTCVAFEGNPPPAIIHWMTFGMKEVVFWWWMWINKSSTTHRESITDMYLSIHKEPSVHPELIYDILHPKFAHMRIQGKRGKVDQEHVIVS